MSARSVSGGWQLAIAYAATAVVASLIFATVAPSKARHETPDQVACEPFGPALFAPSGRLEGTEAVLYTYGTLSARSCRPETVTLVMRGAQAGGVASHTVVSVGMERVFEGEIDGTRRVRVDVEPGSWLAVSFVNDASVDGEDRNLWIDEVAFEARH
jgi:hypothetical protein